MRQNQAPPPNGPLDKLTYINIGAKGTLSGKLHTTTSDIDAILDHLRTKAVKVVIHFHGGLVSAEAGERTARSFVPLYKSAGAHPVVFIWETGFLETILHNLDDIQNTVLFKKILAYVIQQLGEHLRISSFSLAPGEREDIPTIESLIFSPPGLEKYDTEEINAQILKGLAALRESLRALRRRIAREVRNELEELRKDNILSTILRYEVPRTKPLNPKAIAKTRAHAAKGEISISRLADSISRVVYNVADRYRRGRDHGFSATVVEETLREFYIADFGSWVYEGMKQAAQKMWDSNQGLSGTKIHGGRYFLEGLSKLQRQKPKLIIDLVGHSAGSIAICFMLRTARLSGRPIRVRNLILMAPACQSALFYQEIVKRPKRFQVFRMLP